jgi:CRISPR/Cas system-associated endoribonuclease Cas2
VQRCELVCHEARNDNRLRCMRMLLQVRGRSREHSVFYSTLNATDRVRLENEAGQIRNLKVDQLLIGDLGSSDGAAHDATAVLRQSLSEQQKGMAVI